MDFKAFLESLGCYQPLQHEGMRKVPYELSTIVGLIVHSFLSFRGNNEYLVDNDFIYYSGEDPLTAPKPKENFHDIIREDIIVRILHGYPEDLTLYEYLYGDLRLARFDFSFTEPKQTAYHEYIEQIPREIKISVERQERTQLLQRIARHEPNLSRLIQVLHTEGELGEKYATQLEQNLREYGYRGAPSQLYIVK